MSQNLTPIVLTDEQVLEVSALPGTFNYDDKSKMAGKQYRRFKYNNTAFTVSTEHEFCKFYDEERLAMVKLIPTPDEQDASIIRLQLDTAVSQEKLLRMDKFQAQRKYIHTSYNPANADADLLSTLQ